MTEVIVFWILAPVTVLAAATMLVTAKAVHSALLLALVMLGLAVFYIGHGAVFLGVVQVVVYAGAVMMLFLFVVMMVGVDSAESLVERLRGQRVAAALTGLAFGVLVVAGLGELVLEPTAAAARAGGDVPGLATLIFTRYVWAFEVTSALLITAALGTMALTGHRGTRRTQRELSRERIRALARGGQVSPLPPPGVYAGRNSVDVPALLPDGEPAWNSVPGRRGPR
ncbi:NADH:ubiquinone oxidoreductase subunit 6 (chain J) [Saccharomonospora marina XMU15]|uniref:NADH-quinone oxidoreductase subunit J n=1 Tax=Saccharomonospora marina XMU15 TaxID=882083 RepID=H5X7J9_9PSEU|nr:NADH-quinone oxidoreductase subunit J [Saccharomonospora marina]EHR50219.1 NADH:ubiquinone oxidoreductase subunit 6 (chain J) [Saccharomonospora marina XMU15]